MRAQNKQSRQGYPKEKKLVLVAIALLLCCVLGLVAWRQYSHHRAVQREATLYAQSYDQVKDYIHQLAKKASGTIDDKADCDYTSEEFGKGTLGCSVRSSVEIPLAEQHTSEEQILGFADDLQRDLPWKFAYDNTKNIDSTSTDEIKTLVYKSDVLYCDVSYSYKETDTISNQKALQDGLPVLIITADCGGNALSELYPVGNRN